MQIGDVAKQADVNVETIRFYEHKGLIEQPVRPTGRGYRTYPAETVRRIRFIRSAQHIGFSLGEIAELLQLEAAGDSRCLDVKRRAETKRAEVQHKIDNLKRIEKALEHLITCCPGEGPAQDCSILDAINTGALQLPGLSKGDLDDQKNPQD